MNDKERLREQEREPDAWAGQWFDGERQKWRIQGYAKTEESAGLLFINAPDDLRTRVVPVYFGTPPTSTSEGAQERMPMHHASHVWGVGRICDDCEVHAGDPDALEPCPGPESEDV